MKKYLRKLLMLAFIPLILGSCKKDDEQPPVDNKPVEKEEIKVEIGHVYKSNVWDDTINAVCKTAVGDLYVKIPTFIAPSYEAVVDNAYDGDEQFLVCTILCGGTNASSADRLYKEKLIENGFTINAVDGYAYLMKDYSSDLFVDYSVITENEEEYFQIKAVVRKTRDLEWDASFVNLYAGVEVPICPAKAYNNYYDNFKDQVIIYALFVGDNAMNEYEAILQNAGYTYNRNSSSLTSVYDDPTGYVQVQIYERDGDYNSNALYIQITNLWPTIGILSFNGIADFPKLNSENAVYDKYGYIDMGGEGDDKDYVLVVYYDQCTNIDFAAYVNLLVEQYHFEASNQTTSEAGTVSVDLTLATQNYDVVVQVAYSTEHNSICIAFYQCVPQGE